MWNQNYWPGIITQVMTIGCPWHSFKGSDLSTMNLNKYVVGIDRKFMQISGKNVVWKYVSRLKRTMWNIKVWKEVTSTCGHFSHGLSFLLKHLCLGITMKIALYFRDKTFVSIPTLSTFCHNSDESMDTTMMECHHYCDEVFIAIAMINYRQRSDWMSL